jgi:16S rRNA (cytidine1402-2'-O)-methyltransferase
MKTSISGSLFVVSTPIGNLEDISLRAIRTLKEVSCIAAEDTRRTRHLLSHFSIQNRLESYHEYNKLKKSPALIHQILSGNDVAIVSDAGTPGISDPAYFLIQKALEKQISVYPIPGPTAAIAAISVSGLPTDRFIFEGFLPVKKGRQKRIQALVHEKRTIVLFESPHRLLKTLQELHDSLGNRSLAVCRELTKKYEEVIRTRISEAIELFASRKIQGEFVLVIQGETSKKNEKLYESNVNFR